MSQALQSVAHCNPPISTKEPSRVKSRDLFTYGVPPEKKLLTVDLYNRRFYLVRHYLDYIGLTLAERAGILRMLRIYAYYGRVYPKASQISDDFGNMVPGCSKRSFWRAIAKLREDGLIQVYNRFLHGRQISNCYRLDKLIVCLVRFLMEHSGLVLGAISRQLRDALVNPKFWRLIQGAMVNLSAGRVQLKFI